jgi:hypothetical protein
VTFCARTFPLLGGAHIALPLALLAASCAESAAEPQLVARLQQLEDEVATLHATAIHGLPETAEPIHRDRPREPLDDTALAERIERLEWMTADALRATNRQLQSLMERLGVTAEGDAPTSWVPPASNPRERLADAPALLADPGAIGPWTLAGLLAGVLVSAHLGLRLARSQIRLPAHGPHASGSSDETSTAEAWEVAGWLPDPNEDATNPVAGLAGNAGATPFDPLPNGRPNFHSEAPDHARSNETVQSAASPQAESSPAAGPHALVVNLPADTSSEAQRRIEKMVAADVRVLRLPAPEMTRHPGGLSLRLWLLPGLLPGEQEQLRQALHGLATG